ncbi:MAG TPA: S8 family serine peptidase [Candidatus Limnocylindrales bacterium]|nr:S8 family serine peptidase [Candidatus Limnocylindrales bacterium]
MRRATPLALAFLLAFSSGATSARPAQAALLAPGDDVVSTADAVEEAPLSAAGRFIVVYKDGRDVVKATERAGRLGVRSDRSFSHAVRGYAARLDADQVATLRADPDVAAVVPDEIISIAGQSTPTGVRRVNGKQSLVAGIDGSDERVDGDVAIIDTGIGGSTSKQHQDLNIAGGYNCADAKPDDGLPPDRESWGDPNGHGTHVAGTVGALDNGLGVVGVAPGVRLWSVRILNSAGDGLISWYVCGIDWITAQRDPLNADLPLFEAVNMSVAKKGTDDNACGLINKDLIHQAICRLVDSGVTVVAAAGNNGFNAANLKPASYNEVITVSALADTDGQPGGDGGTLCYSWDSYDRDDTFADFSNYGGDVDLIAPGKCIWSTLPGDRYGSISGTSMAAPHVTGAVALYKVSRPLATPAEVRAALRTLGTQDWNTATDPDSVHEPLLDVSHIVALGDWTVDATPGTSHGALVAAEGATLNLPVSLFRAEDVPGLVSLSVEADAPLTAALGVATLEGQDAVATTMDVTVPAATASGSYLVTVTASDGARQRTSTFPVTVDSVAPTATAAVIGLRAGTLLGSVGATASWTPATDPAGSIGQYQVRWRTDGSLGPTTAVSGTTRQASRTVAIGHVYTLRVRARDAAGNWSPWVESAPLAPIVSQETSETLVKSSGWTRYRLTKMSGGSSVYATRHAATITRTFTGRAIALVAPKSAKRGKASIYIDGAYVGTVDLYRSSPLFRVLVYTKSWTNPGQHSLKVVVQSTKNRPRFEVDAFVIVP